MEAKRERVKLLREIMDRQGQVSETQMMKDIIKRLAFVPDQTDVAHDLRRLLNLAESIDNANDLKPLGALPLLIGYLDLARNHSNEIRSVAASIIGKASANNAKFQIELMEIDPTILHRLIGLTQEALGQKEALSQKEALGQEVSLALQGLYALSSMVINSDRHRKLFIDSEGHDLLLTCLAHQAFKLQKKALTFIADLHEHGLEVEGQRKDDVAGLISKSIVERGGMDDDHLEKALHLVLSMVQRDQAWVTLFSSHHLTSSLKLIKQRIQDEEEPNTELLTLIRDAISALSDARSPSKEEL